MKRLREEAGVSIAELMVTLMVSAIVSALLLSTLTMVMRVERFTSEDSQSLGELQTASERFAKELRQARKIYATSTGTRLHFWVDYDRDNQQDAAEKVIWELTTSGGSTSLTRTSEQAGATVRTVASRLAPGSPFTYVPAPPDTTVVRVSLTSVSGGAAGPSGRTVRTQVRLRNAVA